MKVNFYLKKNNTIFGDYLKYCLLINTYYVHKNMNEKVLFFSYKSVQCHPSTVSITYLNNHPPL